MTPDALGALVLASLIAAMVGLVVATAQPSRANVVWGAVALAVLPGTILVGLLVGWLLGR